MATTPGPRSDWLEQLNRDNPTAHGRLSLKNVHPFPGGELAHYELDNGLSVLLLADRSAPVVAYHTWFRVGSRHEQPGKTGLAHLFEHLMFNETENLPAGEFDRTLEAAGGEVNAATWVDWTFYYATVPSSELDLVVRLEADRMAHLVLRDAQVDSEKEVVANERRYRVDDDVEGFVNEQLYAKSYSAHPYHWPTIGWMQDIQGFTTGDCRAFYATYYSPNNATVVVVGDLDERQTLRSIRSAYGDMPRASLPAHEVRADPEPRGERRHELAQPTPTEKLQLGYLSPALSDPDYIVMTVVAELLFGGRSSRLYRALVSEGELASEVRGGPSPFRDPGLFEIWVSMRDGLQAEQALSAIDDCLDSLATGQLGETELAKAKNRLELHFLQGMETAQGKAEQIGFSFTVLGDPTHALSALEDTRRVDTRSVQRAVATYLCRERRTTLLVRCQDTGHSEVA